MWFQEVSILPHGRSLEIPKGSGGGGGGGVGKGGLKSQILEEEYEAKLEFPGD